MALRYKDLEAMPAQKSEAWAPDGTPNLYAAWMGKAGPPPPHWPRGVSASSDLAILNSYPTLSSEGIQRLG